MRRWRHQDGRAKHLSLTESRPLPPVEGFFHRSAEDCRRVLIGERPGHVTIKIVWVRTAKKSTKPEEPEIEGKKCERHGHDDAARGCPEQDQRADVLRILRIVIDFDLIAGLHHGHADLTAAALPGMALSVDDVCDLSAGVRKGV